MNFVGTEDFDIVPFALPNIAKSKSVFDKYVTQIQNEHLRKLFGTYFFDTMTIALDALPEFKTLTAYATGVQIAYLNNVFKASVDIPDTNTDVPVNGATWELIEENNRWLLLKNGTSYTYYDRPYKWLGMKEAVKGLIYAYCARDKYADTLTELGNAKSKSQNAVMAEIAQRQVRGYNRFVDLILGIQEHGYQHRHLSEYCYIENSLIGYLWSNNELYADLFVDKPWSDLRSYLSQEFTEPKRWNTFNI